LGRGSWSCPDVVGEGFGGPVGVFLVVVDVKGEA
jgi:hypothetical protein